MVRKGCILTHLSEDNGEIVSADEKIANYAANNGVNTQVLTDSISYSQLNLNVNLLI